MAVARQIPAQGVQLATSLLLIVIGIAAPEIIGAVTAGYNSQADYLSELGASGAEHAALMNYGVFLPLGLVWTLAVFLFWRALGRSALPTIVAILLLGTSIAYVGAAFFPCDAGCPAEGSASQAMHNLLGLPGYLAAPPALLLAGIHLLALNRRGLGILALVACGIYSLGFVMMIGNADGQTGLWQRFADFSLFVWMAITLPFLSPSQQVDAGSPAP